MNKLKRKKIVVGSLIISLLLLLSIFASGSFGLLSKKNSSPDNMEDIKDIKNVYSVFCGKQFPADSFSYGVNTGEIEVIKKIWDGVGWAESATADMGDIVTFNITIVYEPHCGNMATNINVTDVLPSSLHYDAGFAVIKHGSNTYYGESGISGQQIFWNLSSTYGIYLTLSTPGYPPIVSIIFDATVIGSTDVGGDENEVCVNAVEHCCGLPLYGEDDATVYVICEEPSIDVTKYVKKDGCSYEYKKYVSFDYGDFDYVTFKLYVNLTGSFDEVKIKDCLPSHLSYEPGSAEVDGVSNEPIPCGSNCYCWGLTPVPDDKHYVITFRANVDDCGDTPNHVNVSAKYDCDNWLYDDDEATVDVICEPGIEIIKKINKSGYWVDEITVYTNDEIEFRLVVSNIGDVNLTGVIVVDDLPSFLIYNYDANITPSSSSDHHIEWNLGTLTVGSSQEIIFSAHAISPGEGDNIAEVDTCQGIGDQDDVHVIVAGMIVEKEVWNPYLSAWMEEVDSSVGETVRFRITIYYYGNGTYDLYNIKVKDELPECLDYADNADPTETNVSSDGKTIWWNLSTHVSAGDSTEIEFDALITETSGCGPCVNLVNVTGKECSGKIFYWEDTATVHAECPVVADTGGPYFGELDEQILIEGSAIGGTHPYTYRWDFDDDGLYDDYTGKSLYCSWSSSGTFIIGLKVTDDNGIWDIAESTVTISSPENNPPDKPSKPSGTTLGDAGTSYTYSTSTSDPEGDNVKYGWDWNGDGIVDDWSGFFSSGSSCSMSHSWTTAGNYNVKVKAQDEYGLKGDWSYALAVTISAGNSPPNKPSMPSGPASGKTGTSCSYSSSTTDPDGDQLYYLFDWSDGTDSGWVGPYSSGNTATEAHSWSADGTYPVKVKAKDDPNGDGDLSDGTESVWSDPLSVSMPKNKAISINSLILKYFENHPYMFPLLQQLLRLHLVVHKNL